MRKILLLLFLFILLQSCQSDVLIDNKSMIDKIDQLDFSKTIFEFSIDENGKLQFEMKKSLLNTGNIILESYYRNKEDLFYRESFNFGELYSIFETFVDQKNIIKKAQMISFDAGIPSDTIFMNYDYKYNIDGKKESLVITSVIDSPKVKDIIKYNENEQPEFGNIIIDNDTVQKRKMNYLNGIMIELTKESIDPFRIKNITYDSNEKIKSETIIIKVKDTLKKVEEYIYENTNYEDTELIIINDVLNDTIMKRKKVTVSHNLKTGR